MSADKPKPTPKPKASPKTKPDKVIPVTTSDGVKSDDAVPVKTAPKAKPETSVPPAETKAGRDTIYVDNDDEITAIIDKLEHAKSEDVALVLPKRAQVLQSIVNMRLLKRSAEEAVKKVVLITNDAAVIPLAGAAGVSVAKNLQAKPYVPASPVPVKTAAGVAAATGVADADDLDENEATLDYHRSVGELAVNEDADEPEKINLAEDAAATGAAAAMAKGSDTAKKAVNAVKNKKLKVPNFDRFRLSLTALVAGLVALVVLFIVAGKILPKATINVQTTGTPVSANFAVTTSDKAATLDESKMVIPATNQTKDQTSSQSVQATGTQNNGTKASGSVTLDAACTNYAKAPPVGGGNVVVNNSLNYVLSSATKDWAPTVSGGVCVWEAKFNMTATQGGANYNQSGTFTVKGYSDISGSGSAKDGTDNNVTVVAQADIDKAKASITSQSSDAFSKDFQSKLDAQGLYVVTSTLKVGDPQVNATPGLGQPASSVNVSVKITYSVLTVKKDDLKKLVLDQLKQKIDTSKQQILDSDVLKNVVISVSNQTSPTAMTLNITAGVSATPNIDTDAIKKQSAGKKAGDIRDTISSINGVKSVDVKLSPFWVSKAPAAKKITVNLTLSNDGSSNSSSSSNTSANGQP